MATGIEGPVCVDRVIVSVPADVGFNVVGIIEMVVEPFRGMAEDLVRWNVDIL